LEKREEAQTAPASAAELLRRVPLFAGLDEDSLATLAARCRRRRFKGHATLFHEGDPGEVLYVLITGTVTVQRVTESGETIHLARRGPGEPVGELSLIDGKPRMADVVTAEPCELLMLERADLIRALERSPQIALRIMACLSDRLREAADQLARVQSTKVIGRVAAELVRLLGLYGEPEPAGGRRIRVRMTQRELAEEIGVSRESVNRSFRRLERQKVLRLEDGHVVVLDARKLEAVSHPWRLL
jgi:CRP-like cAMP-binding protein